MKTTRGVLRVRVGLAFVLLVGCGGAEAGGSDLGDESAGSASEELRLSYRTEYIEVEGVASIGPEDINDRGQVVGSSSSDAGGDAFVWSPRAGFRTLARLEGAESMSAMSINERGAVAGTAELGGGVQRPVIWAATGEVTNLGTYGRYVFESPDSSWSVDSGIATDINDRGHVVGSTSSPEFPEVAYLWSPRRGMLLLGTLGGAYSTAWAVNSLDEVVGTAQRADGSYHAFLWSRGQIMDLDALGGSHSTAGAINDLGVVTGDYQTPEGETRVFRWTRARGMVDVGPRYVDADGITSLSTDINVLGQIVGGVRRPGSSIRAAVRHPLGGPWQELMPGSPYESFALGVNNRGVIVGRVAASSAQFEGPIRAAIWYPRLSL